MTPEAKVTRAGLVLSAAFLCPEPARRGTVNLENTYRATCPLCGGRRALTVRTVKDGRLRLATRCGCDGERVWEAIDRAAEFSIGEGWGLDRGEVEIVTAASTRPRYFACYGKRRGTNVRGRSSPRRETIGRKHR